MLAEVVMQTDANVLWLLIPIAIGGVALFILCAGILSHFAGRNIMGLDFIDGVVYFIVWGFMVTVLWSAIWQDPHSRYVETLAIKDKYHLDAAQRYDSKRLLILKDGQECFVKYDTDGSQLFKDDMLCLPDKPVINLELNR